MTEILRGSAYERWIAPQMDAVVEPVRASVEAGPAIEDIAAEDAPQPPTAEEIADIQQQAHDEGFAQGRGEGLVAAQAEAEQRLNEELAKLEQQRQALDADRQQLEAERALLQENAAYLQQLIEHMAQPLEELDEVVEQQLLQLTLGVARQLIRREIKTEPGEVVAVIREAISILPVAASRPKVYLHPEDLQLVTTSLGLGADPERPWQLIEDPTLSRGGCRVVSNDSQIDASVEKRLTAVATKLLGGDRGHEQT